LTKVYGIILASGVGERFGQHIPKQFIKIAGKTIIEHTVEKFEKNDNIDEIIIVINPTFRSLMEEILLKNNYTKVSKLLNGGATRRESSAVAINALTDDHAKVLIHDAVRPFVSDRIINECVQALDKYQAVDVAIPAADTIIQVDDESHITNIPKRKYMMRGQTPQAFRLGIIKKAHELVETDSDASFTDDCGLILKYQLSEVYVVQGEERNIKITYPEEIFLADKLFQINSLAVPESISLDKLKNKVVVIFGASEGIGQKTFQMAKQYGAKSYGFSRRNGVDVAVLADVNKALAQVYAQEGKIDYVVNTAGSLNMGKLATRDMQEIIAEVNINYIGSVHVAKAAFTYLKESQGSMLLFTSSSYTRGRALYSIYSSIKAAIVNLVQALAEEMVDDGVRINVINPERTATPMRWKNFGKEPEGTLLDPEKVAIASLKVLLSDLRGQVIDVRKDS